MNYCSLVCIGIIITTRLAAAAAETRQPAVAGQFYPADAAELARTVDGFLAAVPAETVTGRPVGLLVPHAGYIYSGKTAAYAYRLLKNRKIRTVILIGNSHRYPLTHGAVYTGSACATPLGTLPVDTALAQEIIARAPYLAADRTAHADEHSLEVQLPFLQRIAAQCAIVPILMGEASMEECRATGAAIAAAVRQLGREAGTVLIASSDLSHYPSAATATMIDGKSLQALETFDPQILKQRIDVLSGTNAPNLRCVYCGEQAVFTVMYAARALGADTAQVLRHDHSGCASGETSRVVGYAAAAFLATGSPATSRRAVTSPKETPMKEFSLTKEHQQELLAIARQSITRYLSTRTVPSVTVKDPELRQPAAVFVTLTQHGNLRGCIGTTEPREALATAVSAMAIAAATEDHRFPPLTAAELATTRIEISVLSPLRQVTSADDIRQPVHGVVVKRNGRSGLFLPQVWEHFSTKEDFLSELCSQKAGLPADAWKDPATSLYVFTVVSCEED